MDSMNLVLASQSPRRKELLSVLGLPFIVVPASIEEIPLPGETPEAFVVRAAREKGMEVASRVSQSLVLSADTVVTIDGAILGKPQDEEEAARMLRKLSGRNCPGGITGSTRLSLLSIRSGSRRLTGWIARGCGSIR